MTIDGIQQAAAIVLEEFRRRGIEVRNARWINDSRNALYTTMGVFSEDKFYFLKWDKECWKAAGYETQWFKGAGMAVNRHIYEQWIHTSQADVLYSNTDRIYHCPFVKFTEYAKPHIQKANNENVVVVPFSDKVFSVWYPKPN